MHGIEKEGIRITGQGVLSPTPHPESLGSSLMHPFITTDFTEAQMELRTPPAPGIHESLDYMNALHAYAGGAMAEGELIWPLSMPPRLPSSEKDIPLAVYGRSRLARKKKSYRQGIGLRYGRKRLTISGVHYNISLDPPWLEHHLPENQQAAPFALSGVYFGIIRNLLRKLPYLTYLFGASPAFDKSFDPGGLHRFQKHKGSTFYGPYATCLRQSDIGYTSPVQDCLSISYNGLSAYVWDLEKAKSTANPGYKKFSFPEKRQLNANYLQTEGELYAPFRPKQETGPDESLTKALAQKGVGRLEIRLPDIDPDLPGGIVPGTLRFLHLAVLKALENPSPPLAPFEMNRIKAAQDETVFYGRKKGLQIPVNRQSLDFHQSGRQYCETLYPLAEKMDQGKDGSSYRKAVDCQVKRWKRPELTPSGRQLSHLLDNDLEFIEYGLDIARKNAAFYTTCSPEPEFLAELDESTRRSVERQARLEASDPALQPANE